MRREKRNRSYRLKKRKNKKLRNYFDYLHIQYIESKKERTFTLEEVKKEIGL